MKVLLFIFIMDLIMIITYFQQEEPHEYIFDYKNGLERRVKLHYLSL